MGTPQPPEMTVREPLVALTDRYSGPATEQVLARLQQPDMQGIKAVVSWRGVVVNGDACPVELALAYLKLLQEESCGRCGPCRIGVDIMHELIEKLAAGKAETVDGEDPVARIRRLAESIDDSAWCGIANTIQRPSWRCWTWARSTSPPTPPARPASRTTTHGWVTAPCRSTCPSTVDIPWYIFQGLEEHPHLATTIVKRDNPLPAIIGRTCPHPCESNCTLAPIGQPIAINNIKRWCADRAEGLADDQCASGLHGRPDRGRHARGAGRRRRLADAAASSRAARTKSASSTTAQLSHGPLEVTCSARRQAGRLGGRKKVAIIGAGPAGLSAGYYLARRGYEPTIFEDLPVPGGMVHVGIPEYRLPRHVIHRETELIQQEGVEIRYNTRLGRDIPFADLEKEFEATFVGIGAHLGRPLGIPGEDLPGRHGRHRVPAQGGPGREGRHRRRRAGAGRRQLRHGRGPHRRPPGREERAGGLPPHAERDAGQRLGDRRGRGRGRRVPLPGRSHGVQGRRRRSRAWSASRWSWASPTRAAAASPCPTDMAPFVLTADSIIAAVGQKPDFDPFKGRRRASSSTSTATWRSIRTPS